MFELIYCSCANKDINGKAIENILETSRAFNLKNKITGCLLYHNKEFIQLLEGEEKVLNELYSLIKKDKRHYNIKLLKEGEKVNRGFENWSMAYYEIGESDLKNLSEQLFKSNLTAFSDFEEKPSEAIELFWYLTRQLLRE